jgi:hypothetical protein
MSTIREELERIRRMADPKKGERSGSGIVTRARNPNAAGVCPVAGVRWTSRGRISDEVFRRIWFETQCNLERTAKLAGYSYTSECTLRLKRLGLLA